MGKSRGPWSERTAEVEPKQGKIAAGRGQRTGFRQVQTQVITGDHSCFTVRPEVKGEEREFCQK